MENLFSLLVILIVLALCWRWYDNEGEDEGPDVGT